MAQGLDEYVEASAKPLGAISQPFEHVSQSRAIVPVVRSGQPKRERNRASWVPPLSNTFIAVALHFGVASRRVQLPLCFVFFCLSPTAAFERYSRPFNANNARDFVDLLIWLSFRLHGHLPDFIRWPDYPDHLSTSQQICE